ncbi:MAG: TMEM175 family protein [Sphingobium sp.]
MHKARLEAFSDGVLAIVITIMVLELKVPHGEEIAALFPLWPVFLSYALSFVYIGIYWNNHHHMMQAATKVDGSVLWANLHLLFWLSLLPFATGWMGENHFGRWPVVLYGFNLLMAAIAYKFLQSRLAYVEGNESRIAAAIGRDSKGWISPFLYIAGIVSAFVLAPWTGMAFFVATALLWVVPDRRMERVVGDGRQ